MTTISSAGKAKLQATLDKLAEQLPCVHVAVATPSEIIYEGRAGVFDALEKGKPEAKKANQDDILWFASSTKLLTALCYLRLVDQGKLSLDTDLRPLYEPFKQATSKIIQGFESDSKAVSLDNANPIPIGDTVDVVKQFNEDGKGKAILVDSDEPVTLGQMLNQTSGFGMEFGIKVQLWKKVTEKGKGFVNSCKAENLVNTPLCHKPGTKYEYGNSAEWLALMLPEIVGKSTEDFLQDEILKPLGISKTTYYPFASEEKAKHLMPLRYGKDAEKGGHIQWEILDQQLPLLTLPRDKADMDYPAGGGGIYSRVADWILVLQHILAHYLSLSGDKAKRPSQPLLKDETVKSLFQSTLPESAVESFCEFYSMYLGLPDSDEQKRKLESGDAGWTTAQGLYAPKDGRRRSGWGRRAGSIGWGGAAGTEYWIDPASGIAAVFTTQILPGRCPAVANAKLAIERAIYEALEA